LQSSSDIKPFKFSYNHLYGRQWFHYLAQLLWLSSSIQFSSNFVLHW